MKELIKQLFSVDDTIYDKIVNSVAEYDNYQPEIKDRSNPGAMIPNPVTKDEFLVIHLKKYLTKVVKSGYIAKASNDASQQAAQEIENFTL